MRLILALLLFTLQFAWANVFSDVNAPGELVRLDDGRTVHLLCEGSGKPTVVLDAGHGSWSIYWLDVQQDAAKITRICVFDRPGYGWSDPGKFPRTISANAIDLHATLSASEESGPFVIAGHSYAGLAAMAYTQTYPDEVFALLLLDSAHPEQNSRLPSEIMTPLNGFITRWWKTAALAAVGVETPEIRNQPLLPEVRHNWERWSLSQPHTYATMASELEQFDASIEILKRTSDTLRNKPLLVLTANNSFDWFSQGNNTPPFQEAARLWPIPQNELLNLSDVSAQQFSDGNHALQFSDPGAVVRSIRGLVKLYRGEVDSINRLSDTN